MRHHLDSFIEGHLNLQVKISYHEHYDFLIAHGLNQCLEVLDVGTGNGSFLARLAHDQPSIQFVGIDKRKQCIESCKNLSLKNAQFIQVDMFSLESKFDFSQFDGILMRYFLLHVDHSHKILEFIRLKAKRPSRLWIIDLDYSQMRCEPSNTSFDKLVKLVKEFCSKISVDSMGGQNVLPMLEDLQYQNVVVEKIPFTNQKIHIQDLSLYLKQEVLCYSKMMGKPSNDLDTAEIVRFIDEDFTSGKFQIFYGMILISAEIK